MTVIFRKNVSSACLIHVLWSLGQEPVSNQPAAEDLRSIPCQGARGQPQLAMAPTQQGQGGLEGDRVGCQAQQVAAEWEKSAMPPPRLRHFAPLEGLDQAHDVPWHEIRYH